MDRTKDLPKARLTGYTLTTRPLMSPIISCRYDSTHVTHPVLLFRNKGGHKEITSYGLSSVLMNTDSFSFLAIPFYSLFSIFTLFHFILPSFSHEYSAILDSYISPIFALL